MLLNPFTPSEIAGSPEEFFGRSREIRILERSIQQGSVVIQGPVGIGKSSLLSRIRLHMEGFDSDNKSKSIVVAGNKNIETIDQAAHLLLSEFISVDEIKNEAKIKLGNIVEVGSSEVIHNFKEGRHLAVLKRVLNEDYLQRVLNDGDYLILAIDEADKCPVPLARLMRSICTVTQQQGVKGVRFILSGVTPFIEEIIEEDPGVNRFFSKRIDLAPLSSDESEDLLETKLNKVVQHAKSLGVNIIFEPIILKRIYELSGGHPHLLQLLGYHVIENEETNPDGKIDRYDLVNSIRNICYEDRATVYNSILHKIEVFGKLESLNILISNMANGFPSRISRSAARKLVDPNDIDWFIQNSILSMPTANHYGLIDEFLRAKMILDSLDTIDEQVEKEVYLLNQVPTPEEEDWEPDDM